MSPRSRKFLLTALRIAALLAIFWYVGVAMYRELSKVDADDLAKLKSDWLLVVAAGLCLVGVNSVQMISYRSLLRAYGARPTWRQMAAIAWIPPLGKYLPGKVWALLGAMAMLRRFSISAAIAISVVLMLDAFNVLVGLIISTPLLMSPPISDRFPPGRWIGPILIAAGIIALAPPVFGRLLRIGLKLVKRPPLDRLPRANEYATPIACAIAQWLFAGLGLWLMARSIVPLEFRALPGFIMVAACAMTLSYLALIAPGGLGPREAIFLLLLPGLLNDAGHIVPTGAISLIIIGMRVLQTIVEVSLAGLGAWMLRYEQRHLAESV